MGKGGKDLGSSTLPGDAVLGRGRRGSMGVFSLVEGRRLCQGQVWSLGVVGVAGRGWGGAQFGICLSLRLGQKKIYFSFCFLALK